MCKPPAIRDRMRLEKLKRVIFKWVRHHQTGLGREAILPGLCQVRNPAVVGFLEPTQKEIEPLCHPVLSNCAKESVVIKSFRMTGFSKKAIKIYL